MSEYSHQEQLERLEEEISTYQSLKERIGKLPEGFLESLPEWKYEVEPYNPPKGCLFRCGVGFDWESKQNGTGAIVWLDLLEDRIDIEIFVGDYKNICSSSYEEITVNIEQSIAELLAYWSNSQE